MPPRIASSGIEFIEFTTDANEAETLEQLLGVLGFAKAGQHKSKQVQLWRQGGINILINTEENGFAHSAYLMHGTSVCDIGIRVEDATATAMRAGVLGAELFSQPSVPGELDIPAIKGVGGGVIHFIDDKSDLARLWEIDFIQDNQPADGGVGLVAIDHIAQTMKYEEMLTWALFYTSIFDTSKVPMVDVVDPAGLVRSRAIQNDDGSLRITLNGAESQDTLAGRFISETFGSSVQHIAFASDDIFATADALRRNGFEALTISANYYDDLGARFGLDDQLLDKLKAAQILYDCDEAGAYFHFYGQMLGAGIFFEIVQRTEAYNGYGAANAPFRISAQKRDWASA
jgi:4-hydroxyphenylpyruvate dioxygenase